MTTEQQRGPQPASMLLDQRLALETAAARHGAVPVHARRRPLADGSGFFNLADPAGHLLVDVRPVRDEVERRVLTLHAELGIPHATHEKDT